MEPIPLPEHVVAERPWATPVTFGPPPGVPSSECGTVEALVERFPDERFQTRIRIPLRPSVEELTELLKDDAVVWLTFYADGVVPFSVETWLPDPPSSPMSPGPALDASQAKITDRYEQEGGAS